jgi:hypothetical protein
VLVVSLACWRPWLVHGYLLPWYAVTHFISRYVDYLNHYGCDESSNNPFERSNNSLAWWFNYTTHNFRYHTANHMRPGAHWTELPVIHRTIAGTIPPCCLKQFSWSFLLMPYHFYLRIKPDASPATCPRGMRRRRMVIAAIVNALDARRHAIERRRPDGDDPPDRLAGELFAAARRKGRVLDISPPAGTGPL